MKKILSLFLTLLFSTNIFAADYSHSNSMNAKLFEEIQKKSGTKITIKEAVKMALKDSYQVYAASKMKEISDEVYSQMKSSYYPYVDFNASYNRALLRAKALTKQDDEDEKIMNCDKIIKAEGKIIGIEKLDNDKKMIIWTTNNNFYLYKVNL